MSDWEIAIVATVAVVIFATGFLLGKSGEQKAWTVRAWSNKPHSSNTPHHCDGEFYYIVPESIFVNEFTRKEKI